MKLATVFSGIGAVEHALETIGIKYDLVFACDNGDINPFDLKVKKDYLSLVDAYLVVQEKIKLLSIHEFEDNHSVSINEQLDIVTSKLSVIKEKLEELNDKLLVDSQIQKLINEIKLEDLPPSLKRKVEAYQKINLITLDLLEDYLKFLSTKNEIVEDIKKSPLAKEVNQVINKAIIELNMLNERVESEEIRYKISEAKNLKEKKEIVDQLYKDSKKKNYVYESYKANYNITDDKFHQDVRFLDGTHFKGEVDLFVGGSPCQSFSMVGKRRGLEDTRGTLFYEYARLVSEIQPKVFIYENVKGLLNHDGGETWKTMQTVFEDLGYDWHAKVLNAKNYGIPQNRERIFVVGFRRDLVLQKPFEFPNEIPLEIKMQDLLMDSVSGKYYLNKKGVDFVTNPKNIQKRYTQISGDIQLCQKANQQFNWHGDFIFEEDKRDDSEKVEDLEKYFLSQKVKKYVMASGTKDFYSKPEIDLKVARPILTTMHKMHRAGVDNYVTTSGRIRKLTPRETLRLMGFCDSFKISVSDTQMYRQAGNSIVVNVLIHLLNSIYSSYNEIFKVSIRNS